VSGPCQTNNIIITTIIIINQPICKKQIGCTTNQPTNRTIGVCVCVCVCALKPVARCACRRVRGAEQHRRAREGAVALRQHVANAHVADRRRAHARGADGRAQHLRQKVVGVRVRKRAAPRTRDGGPHGGEHQHVFIPPVDRRHVFFVTAAANFIIIIIIFFFSNTGSFWHQNTEYSWSR
jgi:hypothetical protein